MSSPCGRCVRSQPPANAHLAVLKQAVQLVRSLAPSSCAARDALRCVGVSATVRTGVAGDSKQRLSPPCALSQAATARWAVSHATTTRAAASGHPPSSRGPALTCSSVRSTLNTLDSPRCVLMLFTPCFADARTRIVQLLVYGFSASSGCTRLALAPALPGVTAAPTFLYERAEKG